MTRRNFDAIAQLISQHTQRISTNNCYTINLNLIEDLAYYFQKINPNFNMVKFRRACMKGLPDGDQKE